MLIAVLSELLVAAVEPTVAALGVSEFFIGIIVVPLIGNVAEHLVAVQTALKNKMELSMAVSLGSSLQIALFVAPVLVFVSLLMGNPFTLVFNQFEIVALFAGSSSPHSWRRTARATGWRAPNCWRCTPSWRWRSSSSRCPAFIDKSRPGAPLGTCPTAPPAQTRASPPEIGCQPPSFGYPTALPAISRRIARR